MIKITFGLISELILNLYKAVGALINSDVLMKKVVSYYFLSTFHTLYHDNIYIKYETLLNILART